MSDFATKSTRCLPMLVKVRKKTDPEPLIATFDDVGGLAPQLNSNAFPPPADSPSGNQNPNATRIVSPARKPAPPKRRKISAGSFGGSAGRGGRGGRGNSGQSVRARIIGSMAELRALGKPNPPRIEVALFAGYSNAASKGFSNPLSSLKTEGIVDYPDKKSVSLTTIGLNSPEAKAVVPPKDNGEVQARLKALLRPKQVEIFDFLADGKAHLREDVAAAVGYSNPASKGYVNSVGKMSSLGIVCYPNDNANPKRKWVQLTDMCFPFSKPSSTGDQLGSNLPAPPPPNLPSLPHAQPATAISTTKIEQPDAHYSTQVSYIDSKGEAESADSDVEVVEEHIGHRIAKYFGDKLYLGSVTKHGENKGNEVFWIMYDDGDEESMSRTALNSALCLYLEEGAEVDTRKPPAT